MKEKKSLATILKNDRVSRLIFGGMLMDGLLLISLLALAAFRIALS